MIMGYQPFDPSEGAFSQGARQRKKSAYATMGAGLSAAASAKMGEYAAPAVTESQGPSTASRIQMAGEGLAGAIGGISRLFPRSTPAAGGGSSYNPGSAFSYSGPDYSSAFKNQSPVLNFANAWKT